MVGSGLLIFALICDWLEMPVRHDLLKSARQHNYCGISGWSQQLSVWEVKIKPCSLTAGSLSALNYTKLVQHISLPENEPECCSTCLTHSNQLCSLNRLGMMYLDPAAICLRYDAQNIKTEWVSNTFKMHCGNNLCWQRRYALSVGLGFFVREICERLDLEEQQQILSLCLKSLIWLYSWFLISYMIWRGKGRNY